jgi:hypothetical protein
MDQKHYYALQTAMLSLGSSERSKEVVTTILTATTLALRLHLCHRLDVAQPSSQLTLPTIDYATRLQASADKQQDGDILMWRASASLSRECH